MKYSVLVVNYNKEEYLEKCLNSIINQTYKNFELIIVDDGSTDNSRNIINKYKKYDNVKIYLKENTGVSDSRNYAIDKVKTKYFTFVDSDDYIDEKLLEECEKYDDYEILSFNSYKVKNKKIKKELPKGIFYKQKGQNVLYKYTRNNVLYLVPWGYIYKTELFKKNKLKYPKDYVHEDTYLTTIAILESNKITGIDYYGYYYNQTQNSITRARDYEAQRLRIKSSIYVYKEIKKYLEKKIGDKEKRKKIISYYVSGTLYEGNTFYGKAKKEYIKELKKLNLHEDIYLYNKKTKVKRILVKYSISFFYKIYPEFLLMEKLYVIMVKRLERIRVNKYEKNKAR